MHEEPLVFSNNEDYEHHLDIVIECCKESGSKFKLNKPPSYPCIATMSASVTKGITFFRWYYTSLDEAEKYLKENNDI